MFTKCLGHFMLNLRFSRIVNALMGNLNYKMHLPYVQVNVLGTYPTPLSKQVFQTFRKIHVKFCLNRPFVFWAIIFRPYTLNNI